jgi:hypothetical protein
MWKVSRPEPPERELGPTVPIFIPIRRNKEDNFWVWVIRAVGSMGPEANEAVPDLLRIVRHATGTFQVVAMQALRKIDPLVDHRAG